MKKTNRYVVALFGVVLHLMLGSTYAWSVYRNPIMEETSWDVFAVAFAFSLAIFCLGMSAAFMGRLVERFGPRVTGLISAASPMAQDMAGLSAESAAVLVGLLGIFNGFGRLLWASFSDYIGRPLTFFILFLVNLGMTASLFFAKEAMLFSIAMSVLMKCYGSGFSLLPAYLSDMFGTKELAALHGYSLTAWAAAGLFGPILLSENYSWSQSYTTTLIVFLAFYSIGLVTTFYLRSLMNKK
ncbi:hypothetical protein K6V78_02345 [Streptococcus gallolyticus]|uniref:hypothetical protein n=1 Tax=Streptococcus hepaticus TaxID=3349163 RepID=UPI001C9527AF|nr:hypothetical protein [Streptococcus gallolyticus]MBY5040479.1 hypothetical protein [Streptococcus gallolyticus]